MADDFTRFPCILGIATPENAARDLATGEMVDLIGTQGWQTAVLDGGVPNA